jgi:hypothetical protein
MRLRPHTLLAGGPAADSRGTGAGASPAEAVPWILIATPYNVRFGPRGGGIWPPGWCLTGACAVPIAGAAHPPGYHRGAAFRRILVPSGGGAAARCDSGRRGAPPQLHSWRGRIHQRGWVSGPNSAGPGSCRPGLHAAGATLGPKAVRRWLAAPQRGGERPTVPVASWHGRCARRPGAGGAGAEEAGWGGRCGTAAAGRPGKWEPRGGHQLVDRGVCGR